MMGLRIGLGSDISNATKGLAYPHWTQTGFQMRWSKFEKTIVMYSKHVTLFLRGNLGKKEGKKLVKKPFGI